MPEYVQYYRDLRPHQGIGNVRLPHPQEAPAETATGNDDCVLLSLADIECERCLGGLLKHFYRRAA